MKIDNSYFYNLLYVMLLGAGFPILRYMSLHFDANNNNMVRFLSGGTLLFIYGLWRFYPQYLILFKQKILLIKVIMLSFLMTANMYLMMRGFTYTNAVTGSIFSVLAMPIGVGLAAIFYIDERQCLKEKHFYLGSCIAILASLFFVIEGNSTTISTTNSNFLLGSLFLFIAIVIQGIQSLIIKSTNNQVNAIVISTFTALFAGFINLAISFEFEKLSQLEFVSEGLLLGLVLAGIYGIATGMFMSFHIIQSQGIVIFSLLQLMIPFFASIFAYLCLNERLTLWQILSGIVVMIGCMYSLGLTKYLRGARK